MSTSDPDIVRLGKGENFYWLILGTWVPVALMLVITHVLLIQGHWADALEPLISGGLALAVLGVTAYYFSWVGLVPLKASIRYGDLVLELPLRKVRIRLADIQQIKAGRRGWFLVTLKDGSEIDLTGLNKSAMAEMTRRVENLDSGAP